MAIESKVRLSVVQQGWQSEYYEPSVTNLLLVFVVPLPVDPVASLVVEAFPEWLLLLLLLVLPAPLL